MFEWVPWLTTQENSRQPPKRRKTPLLVSTYVVCERLSVMHEPAGVVEILVQILQNTPYSEKQFQNTPPPPKNENSQRVQVREFQNTPPPLPRKLKFRQILAL